MSNHYFTNDPNLKHDFQRIVYVNDGITYRFFTDSGVFSKSQVDFGSKTLIEAFKYNNYQSLLDLGCGYGVIGIVLKTQYPVMEVTQSDINIRALELTKENAKENKVETHSIISDGYKNVTGLFDCITLNPPIRAGKETIFKLYDETYKHLNPDGEFWIVIQKKQGAPSHLKYLQNLFSNVELVTKNKGYHVLRMKKVHKGWLFAYINIKY